MEKEPTIATSVRLPVSLKKDLEKIAEREERTLNNMMTIALKEYVRQHKGD